MVSLAIVAAMMDTMYFFWAKCEHGGGVSGGGTVCVSTKLQSSIHHQPLREFYWTFETLVGSRHLFYLLIILKAVGVTYPYFPIDNERKKLVIYFFGKFVRENLKGTENEKT